MPSNRSAKVSSEMNGGQITTSMPSWNHKIRNSKVFIFQLPAIMGFLIGFLIEEKHA